MPTERFYRLPKEKQIIIRDAAIREFTRVPFEKVSINQIIQYADISRGSFYTYFEDKRDVLSFIFQDIKFETHIFCKETFINSDGDFWYMMERLLEYCIDLCSSNHLFELSKNLLVDQGLFDLFEAKGNFTPGYSGEQRLGQWLFDHMDKTKFRSQQRDDFDILMSMSMAALALSMAQYHKMGDPIEQVKKAFKARMKLVKYGIYT